MSLGRTLSPCTLAGDSLPLRSHRTQSEIIDRKSLIFIRIQFSHWYRRLSAGQATCHLSKTGALRIVIFLKVRVLRANYFDRALVERVSPPIAIRVVKDNEIRNLTIKENGYD